MFCDRVMVAQSFHMSVAAIAIGDIITMVLMAVEQTATRGKECPQSSHSHCRHPNPTTNVSSRWADVDNDNGGGG